MVVVCTQQRLRRWREKVEDLFRKHDAQETVNYSLLICTFWNSPLNRAS